MRLAWSDSGPEGEDNAYGEIEARVGDGSYGPVICGHGGSMWLCRACKERILKANPETVRRKK